MSRKPWDAQQDAKEQFKSALDRFTKTRNIQGGELQEKYDVQNGEYERSEQRAQAVIAVSRTPSSGRWGQVLQSLHFTSRRRNSHHAGYLLRARLLYQTR
jgi:hypothetical protein